MKVARISHKRLNSGKPTEIIYDLNDIDVRSQLQEIFISNVYNPHIDRKNLVVFDFGANIGMSALYFKDMAKVVHAFEPHPYIYQMLQNNVKPYNNIKTYKYAILNQIGKLRVGTKEKGNLTQNLLQKGSYDEQEITCIDFAECLKITGEDHVDVLKIDIEGSEYIVFSSNEFIENASKIDTIVGESHYTGTAMPQFVPVMLKECGFKTRFIKLRIPNYEKMLGINMPDGSKKTYNISENTNFIAKHI